MPPRQCWRGVQFIFGHWVVSTTRRPRPSGGSLRERGSGGYCSPAESWSVSFLLLPRQVFGRKGFLRPDTIVWRRQVHNWVRGWVLKENRRTSLGGSRGPVLWKCTGPRTEANVSLFARYHQRRLRAAEMRRPRQMAPEARLVFFSPPLTFACPRSCPHAERR